MQTHRTPSAKSEGGFTLIELLVVMIIIAILMAVALPTFLSQKNNAVKTKATSNIKQVINAIEGCATNNTDGTYANCNTGSILATYEPALKSLGTISSGTAPALGRYAVQFNGTAGSETGFVVSAKVADAGYTAGIVFWEEHKTDGSVVKGCGASYSATAGTGVAASKTCKAGTW